MLKHARKHEARPLQEKEKEKRRGKKKKKRRSLSIQTLKGSNERLFILTRTHSINISEKSPLSKHKRTLKQQINDQKRWKMKEKDFFSFGLVLTACSVLGRLLVSEFCLDSNDSGYICAYVRKVGGYKIK